MYPSSQGLFDVLGLDITSIDLLDHHASSSTTNINNYMIKWTSLHNTVPTQKQTWMKSTLNAVDDIFFIETIFTNNIMVAKDVNM